MSLVWWLAAALAAPWQPDAAEQAVIARLSARHFDDCATVQAWLTDPAASLAAIAEHVPTPAWTAMRAVSCLPHTPQAQTLLTRWAQNPDQAGLALALWMRLDRVASASHALELAQIMRKSAFLQPHLAQSVHADVRRLAHTP